MRHGNLPHMPGGEYVLHQDYATTPNTLILCRILARCFHVREALEGISRQALAECRHPFQEAFAEYSVRPNVVYSLDLAGLTGRLLHQSVTRAIERRAERKRGRGSAIYPAKSRYVAPTGLRSSMYIMDRHGLRGARIHEGAEWEAYAELRDALVGCGVLWFKPDTWGTGKQWPRYDFKAFRWPQWAMDYLDSL